VDGRDVAGYILGGAMLAVTVCIALAMAYEMYYR